MAEIVWSPRALADINEACEFIAQDAPPRADDFAEHVFRVAARLDLFPRSGRIVPEIGDQDIREVIVQSHRVMYRVESNGVQILRVWHGARRVIGVLDV